MKEMPEFLPVSDEPDLYAIAEKEAEEERKRLGDKAPRVPPGESSKDFAGKGGASKDAGASMLKPTKSIKTQHPSKPKVERKKFSTGGKVVVPKRKERRKFEEFDNPFAYQSRFDPIQTEDDESTVLEKMAEMSPASRRMSKMQFLQNIPLCQYYVPPLQQSPRPYSMPPILRDAIQLDDKSRGFLLFGDSNGLDPSIQNQKSPKKRKLSLSTERDNEYPSKLAKSISTGDAMNRPQTEGHSQFSTAATPRGVTMRESGKWVSCCWCHGTIKSSCASPLTVPRFPIFFPQQAQVYYAGQSRYIGVFVSREEACIAYESVREKLRRAKVGAHDSNSTQDDPFNSAKRAVIESARKRHALG